MPRIVRRVQFLTGRRPMRSFSPGAVATIALWKSAPMVTTDTRASIRVFELHCAAPTVCSYLLFKKMELQ